MFNKIIYKSYALNYDNSFPQKKNKNKNDKNMYAYIFHSNECLHDTCIMTGLQIINNIH